MSRFGTLGTQYFDNSGDPLAYGFIQFYESGTTTPKNTYADINQTVLNANPLPLTASGRQPNCFFDGVARAILYDSEMGQIEVRDPVGDTVTNEQFQPWQPEFAYEQGAIVEGPDGLFYVSLVNQNLGNVPATSPSDWELLADSIIDQYTGVAAGRVAIGASPSGLTGLNTIPKGTILVGNGTTTTTLAAAANGLVLAYDDTQPTGFTAVSQLQDIPIYRTERTSDIQLDASDRGTLIDVTSGTFTQSFDTAANLGDGWYVFYQNSGTGVVTTGVSVSGAAINIRGGESLIIQTDGVNFYGALRNLPGLRLLSTSTVSAAATADIVLPSGYSEYEVRLLNVKPATDNVSLFLRTSTDGGSTFDAGASDYNFQYNAAVAATEAQIRLSSSNLGNDTNETGMSAVIHLSQPALSAYMQCHWTGSFIRTNGAIEAVYGSGQRLSAADVNAIRFLFASGNIASGIIKLYGVK